MSDELSPPSLELLVFELKEVVDWELLSVHLHLGHEYERINAENGRYGVERCKLEVFNLWLKKNKNVTWEHVSMALERMEEVTLATYLREKYALILHAKHTHIETVFVQKRPQKKFDRIQGQFAHLLVHIKMSLRSCWTAIDPSCFFDYLQTFVPGIQMLPSAEGLFSEVSKHCDFLNFSLIGHIIRYEPLKKNTKFIRIKKKYKRYKSDLRKFKNSTEMRDLVDNIHHYHQMNDMASVKIKFESFLEKIRLKKFIDLLKEIFQIYYESLIKIEVTEGCFYVQWLIPKVMADSLVEKILTNPNEFNHFMEGIGILSFEIAEKNIYKRGDTASGDTEHILVAFSNVIKSQNVKACEFLLYAFHNTILKEYPLVQELSKLSKDFACSMLEISSSRGHLEVVDTLLHLGFYQERLNTSPLMIASGEGHSVVVDFLLESIPHINVNKQGPDGETALHLSCSKNHSAIVKSLLCHKEKHHLNIDIADNNDMTPLMISVGSGQRRTVQRLLAFEADPNIKKRDGDTALHIACSQGNCGIVRDLLKCKADPCASKTDGWTPLMVAIPSNQVKVVDLLLKQKTVDPNKKNEHDGDNALLIASWNNCHGIVKLLLSNNADPNITKYDGWTPLIAASLLGFNDIAYSLIEHGAYVNTQANDGVTPLYVACQEGHSDVVSLLLDNNANVYLYKTDSGRSTYTPFAIACQNGHIDVVEILLKRDRKQLETRNESGATPLFIASFNEQAKVVKFLLDNNANKYSVDNQGQNALDVAQDEACRALLLKAGVTKTIVPTPAPKQLFSDRIISNTKNLRARLVGGVLKKFRKIRQQTRETRTS